MIVAFYYHYPVLMQENRFYLPGFLGCFVDAMAKQVSKLILVAHTTNVNKNMLYDYALQSNNIEYLFIGERTPAWHRHLFHKRILKNISMKLSEADFFIVRSPTPLAPFFQRNCPQTKVVYMVVGDYQESVKQIPTKSIRDFIMKQYVKRNDYLFRKSMRTTDLLVNAPSLFEKYKANSKSIHQIRTTTLSESDFFYRTDVLQNPTIRLLYTGRLDRAKGLFELVQAFVELHAQNANFKLDIVGWEDHKDKPIEQSLKALAQENNVLNDITFHGKKRIGAELNALYQQADIYIIPSYHEGFPRTIWEAMANGLPVVATTVGAIPHYLSHQVNALLMEPKKVEPIIASVQEIVSNRTLRKRMIEGGYALAKENTLEIQTEKMMNILHTLT